MQHCRGRQCARRLASERTIVCRRRRRGWGEKWRQVQSDGARGEGLGEEYERWLELYEKLDEIIRKHVMKWESERKTVVEAAQHLLRLGLVAATSGNVSMRLEGGGKDGLIAITPTSMDYEKMTAEDIVVVDYDVDVVEGETVPSSESLTHVAVYKAQTGYPGGDPHAFHLCKRPCCSGGVALPPVLDELVAYLGGTVEVAEYGFPSTEDLGEKGGGGDGRAERGVHPQPRGAGGGSGHGGCAEGLRAGGKGVADIHTGPGVWGGGNAAGGDRGGGEEHVQDETGNGGVG